ncbi:ASF1 like histone chaperone-domain-containing protein [Xylogone sp. PMI_703]|nr:ASF1 like histone chaperone-domain-containing protein [Xylogone sp. PMI_703]
MSVVSLLGVNVLKNPAKFTDPYEFEITFECLESLQKDLEWKLIYVGSATSSEHDQELDSLLVGPIPVGVNKFIFEADPPDTKRIPDAEILGVTVVLLTCAYDGREFVRVGYYVNNEYDSDELNADPPAKPLIDRVKRNVLAEKPRVTRFAIKWDSDASAPPEFPPDQPEADLVADGEEYGAEEAELEEEEEEAEAEGPVDPDAMVDDSAMAGVEAAAAEEDDNASEDLEAESSGSEEEDIEEEEGEEGEGGANEDEDMEMDGVEKAEGANAGAEHHADAVMAH